MIAYIICEGIDDKRILQTLLPEASLNQVEIVVGGGISSVKSIARSLVVRRQTPVVIVVDSDSTVPELVKMRIGEITDIVESVSVNTPVKVVLFVPEIEIIFFRDPLLLSRLLGYDPSQEELNLAILQPRKVLEQLLAKSEKVCDRSQIINQIANENINYLRNDPAIQELIDFLQSVNKLVKV
ncbi:MULTISPECIES: hypothetical protein [Pseudanabaena]|jgi:hypothetical protein|uniref:hypothetical protein n=1 Tax=Pseudanabaena TaxID=1152 RepID=UPI002479BE6E|nr:MULTISPECIES: hypothetical protein [Pseudanabaena]MEA5485453.1 hypothetical protein [Pseudanabaena sp. CCNP1317]WGS73671.1 hypothetical protein OA858_06465 [Pseudanabaena galeata CCNP1313]